MKRTTRTLTLITGGALLLGAQLAHAATYTFSFSVGGDAAVTGANPYSGSFSFNQAAPIAGPGGSTLYDLTTFELDFLNGGLGALFDLADDLGTPTAQVGWDNQFIGISYSATIGDDTLTFSPGNAGFAPIVPSDPSVSAMTYSLNGGAYNGNSAGAITFTRVPEPSNTLLPGLSLLMGAALWRRRREAPRKNAR